MLSPEQIQALCEGSRPKLEAMRAVIRLDLVNLDDSRPIERHGCRHRLERPGGRAGAV